MIESFLCTKVKKNRQCQRARGSICNVHNGGLTCPYKWNPRGVPAHTRWNYMLDDRIILFSKKKQLWLPTSHHWLPNKRKQFYHVLSMKDRMLLNTAEISLTYFPCQKIAGICIKTPKLHGVGHPTKKNAMFNRLSRLNVWTFRWRTASVLLCLNIKSAEHQRLQKCVPVIGSVNAKF